MDKGRVIYNSEMAKAVRQVKPPFSGIVIDIAEYPEFLTIRMYEDNIMSFDINQRVTITDYITLVRKVIESYGVRCEFEGVPGDGRTKVQR
jgi:hypothetical protein